LDALVAVAPVLAEVLERVRGVAGVVPPQVAVVAGHVRLLVRAGVRDAAGHGVALVRAGLDRRGLVAVHLRPDGVDALVLGLGLGPGVGVGVGRAAVHAALPGPVRPVSARLRPGLGPGLGVGLQADPFVAAGLADLGDDLGLPPAILLQQRN